MKLAVACYRDIAASWICAAVYLWVLELRAAIGTDSEPVAAWLADCAAILLTLVFWAAVLALPITIFGITGGIDRIRSINKLVVKACLVSITAVHLVRWLLNWQNIVTNVDLGLVLLAIGATVLTILAIIQRRKPKTEEVVSLPSLDDCFHFGALPLLVGAIALVAVRVVGVRIPWPKDVTNAATNSNAGSASQERPSIILVVADALRAQSMSLYGNDRETTPNLDQWARSATVYVSSHANSTSTKPSMTSILTGKHPLSHGRLTKAQPPVNSGEHLLRILRDRGYYIGAVTSNEDASLRLLGFGWSLSTHEQTAFQHLTLSWLRQSGIYPTPTGGRIYLSLAQFIPFFGYPRRTSYYGFADDTLNAAKQFVASAKRPFFLFLHLHEPHDPYDAPPPFRGMYSRQSTSVPRKLSASHYARYGTVSQSDVDAFKDEYEESVRYLDEALGRFLQRIANLMSREAYAVAITSDHGESFERGYMNHGEELFETSTHVPLVIRFPHQSQGTRLSGLSQSIDIAPTLLAIAGIDAPHWMDGHVLHSDRMPAVKSTLAVNFKDPIGQRSFSMPTKLALWSTPYKLIQDCETGRSQLYNLTDDPEERTDLSESAAAELARLQALLKGKLIRQIKGPKLSCDPSVGY